MGGIFTKKPPIMGVNAHNGRYRPLWAVFTTAHYGRFLKKPPIMGGGFIKKRPLWAVWPLTASNIVKVLTYILWAKNDHFRPKYGYFG